MPVTPTEHTTTVGEVRAGYEKAISYLHRFVWVVAAASALGGFVLGQFVHI